ncbi:MAG: alpha/beta fold hydrolase [Ferruginibacter sp.]
MQNVKNIIVAGSAGRQMAVDICHDTNEGRKPIVIYAHGFNGFKDWGNFDLIAAKFAGAGFSFIKFNFSHNGTTPAQPAEFTDLEAFGQNNYSIELHDLNAIIDWIHSPLNNYSNILDTEELSLIGHSMGGGIVLLQAAADNRVSKAVTWAGVSECKTPWGNWPAEKMQEWRDRGVQYYTNSRTQQQMPMYYQLYEDYQMNADKLNIQKAISSLNIPVLLCHGTIDTAVPVEKAWELKAWQPNAKIFTVESDHVFGRMHPWVGNDLPAPMDEVVNETIRFLR